MKQEIKHEFVLNAEGKPTGGSTTGVGMDIRWQDGQLGRGEDRKEPNGAFVEGTLQVSIDRLIFLNKYFPCRENSVALTHMETALLWLGKRTADREARGVEGTHTL